MKILHCCLANFYIDNCSYQENILPRIHREIGHETEVLASTETFVDHVNLGYTRARSYVSSDGVPITRLSYAKWMPAIFARKLRIYVGLSAELERFQPDVVFLHDCQFLSIWRIARYARKTGATVYVDSHTDYINSGRGFVSRYLLHGLVYRLCAAVIDPVTRRFYATLPLRIDFLRDVYKIPASKIEVLPFGADDARLQNEDRAEIRAATRKSLDLGDNELVFITGGKIDEKKNIHLLINAFLSLVDSGAIDGVKLVIFGRPAKSLEKVIERAARHPAIRYVDWLDASQIYKSFWAADVAVFPGTHSVLWEEAVGLGVPCVFRRWRGIEHVDLGGNCIMLDDPDEASLATAIVSIANVPGALSQMRKIAREQGPKIFRYSVIAQRAIEAADEEPANLGDTGGHS